MKNWWNETALTDDDVTSIQEAALAGDPSPTNVCTIPLMFDRDTAGSMLSALQRVVSGETIPMDDPAWQWLHDLGSTIVWQYRVDPDWEPDGLVNEHSEFFCGEWEDSESDDEPSEDDDEEDEDEDDPDEAV